MKWYVFHQRNNGSIETLCIKFQHWKDAGMAVHIIRYDHAGKNKLLEEQCNSADWKLSIGFEYTTRNTPQQNSLAETSFYTIRCRGSAMMIAANVPYEVKYKLFREAFTCAMQLDSLVIKELDGVKQTRIEHWCGELPRWARALR
eukprot:12938244-Ditylum_brightwellii.AAC.1